ncbi:MAG TPA: type 2 lanthipeptide synthetase LanM [Acidisarcina sp.]
MSNATSLNATTHQFLLGAQDIGLRLCRDAVWAGPRCTWLGSSMEFISGAWVTAEKPAGADIYAGTSGIALFLAELYAATRERPLRKAALGGVALAISSLETSSLANPIGFYSGSVGIAYALLRIGQKLDEPSLVERALTGLDSLTGTNLESSLLDVIGGCGGAIPVLLRLSVEFDRPAYLDLATRCGRHLIATAKVSDGTLSWNTIGGPSGRNLTGFSHGTAGIGWALTELWRATRERAFLDAANGAFAYERRLFSPDRGNWPDLRVMDGQSASEPGYALAWCHGAPGIGLSRLRVYAITNDEIFRSEAEMALATTSRSLEVASGAVNYSLCHGAFGNADLLLEAAAALGRSEARARAEQLGVQALNYAATGVPWPCGVPNGGETPGLLLGLAGIGYFLLRLYDPSLESLLIVGPKHPVKHHVEAGIL